MPETREVFLVPPSPLTRTSYPSTGCKIHQFLSISIAPTTLQVMLILCQEEQGWSLEESGTGKGTRLNSRMEPCSLLPLPCITVAWGQNWKSLGIGEWKELGPVTLCNAGQ